MAAISGFNNHGVADRPIAAHPVHKHLRQLAVSEDGARYVAMATDPFANHPIDVVGLPDATGGRSLVYLVEQEITLTAPSLLEGNWDAHVAFQPFETEDVAWSKVDVTSCGRRGAAASTNFVSDIGKCLVACSVPEGDLTFADVGVAGMYESFRMEPLFADAPRCRSRLVAGAFKVVNTTAEINKQGSVTCYRCENSPGTGVTYDDVADVGNTAGVTFTRALVNFVNTPPQTVGAAKQLESTTHSAAEGALCILCPDHLDNPPRAPLPNDVVMMGGVPGTFLADSQEAFTTRRYRTTDNNDGQACPTAFLPFMSQGAYFTGLSNSTTLTVTCRMVIEVFPPPASVLYPLCREAAPDDSAALEIAARIQSQLRPGYPSSHNSWGTFTKAIMGAIKRVAPIAQAVLPFAGPRGAAAAAAMRALQHTNGGIAPQTQAKKKKTKKKK